MVICFDWDGTVVEGPYDDSPISNETYAGRRPLDVYTQGVWDALCAEHTVHVITARPTEDALRGITGWLLYRDWRLPASIITGIRASRKPEIVKALKGQVFFDDAPEALPSEGIKGCELFEVWNPSRRFLSTKFPSVRTWKEIEEIITQMEPLNA